MRFGLTWIVGAGCQALNCQKLLHLIHNGQQYISQEQQANSVLEVSSLTRLMALLGCVGIGPVRRAVFSFTHLVYVRPACAEIGMATAVGPNGCDALRRVDTSKGRRRPVTLNAWGHAWRLAIGWNASQKCSLQCDSARERGELGSTTSRACVLRRGGGAWPTLRPGVTVGVGGLLSRPGPPASS